MSINIYISAGETSGDTHGAGLAAELYKLNEEFHISGMGGESMSECGVEIFRDCRDYSVMGFFGVIARLGDFRKLLVDVQKHIRERGITTVILIDYSGFNLRLAKALNGSGVKVIYFVSPQVWAWRTGRVKMIREFTERMITIFPFEKEFYQKHGVDVDYVGHPILDRIPLLDINQRREKAEAFKIKNQLVPDAPTLALFPGSRKQEVERMLPTMLDTAMLIKKEIGALNVTIALAPGMDISRYIEMDNYRKLKLATVRNNSTDVLFSSDSALVSSGSTTIEAAVCGTPQVVMYKTGFTTYLIARSMVEVDYIAMANLVAGEQIVPEFIQSGARPESLKKALLPLLTDKDTWFQAHKEALAIRDKLGENGAYRRAAEIVMDIIKSS
ncbi:MAG: lipid-A-disaccharide synthase [candidate division Zixibacteria bacterium]|nr:lipid-A-disaccharide synthase [candidate division Zixibacteria bacterium]